MRKEHYAWIICFAGALLIFISMGVVSNGFSIFLPYIREEFGLTNAQTSTLVTVRLIMNFVSLLFIGIYYDHLNIRLGATLSVGFAVCFVILDGYTETETVAMLLYSLTAGIAAGLLYTFCERAYRFAEGFLFGTALASWLVPQILNMEADGRTGRIVRLVIAIAAGVLFALLAKILRPVLSALLGGTVLALLTESFVSYESIPYLPQILDLSEGMYRNILPLAFAGIGFLVQLPQWITGIREEKERKAAERYAAQLSADSSESSTESAPRETEENAQTDRGQTQAGLSVAEAEAVLVEKARELALAASRNAEEMRLRERYEDVAEGLYSAQAAADRLGMTEEQFLEGMRLSGYEVPNTEQESGDTESPEPAAEEPEAEEPAAEEQEAEEQPEGEPDGNIREEGPDLSEEGQADLGEDQESTE